MDGKEDYRIFVGGLSWDITERRLEDTFSQFGKILDSQIMVERDTGRPRGFGFITFADRRGMEDAIRDMHGQDFGDRTISVNKAEPKSGDEFGRGSYGGRSYPPGGGARSNYGVPDRSVGQDECFKCGRHGHWARECPSAGGGRGGAFQVSSSRSRFGGDRYDRERERDRDRYVDERNDGGGRYGDRARLDVRESRYGPRDPFVDDRYVAPVADRGFAGERYGGMSGSDRFPSNGYGKDRGGYEREMALPRGGSERYGSGGPARNEGRSYRSRGAPYDRGIAVRARPSSSFDRY